MTAGIACTARLLLICVYPEASSDPLAAVVATAEGQLQGWSLRGGARRKKEKREIKQKKLRRRAHYEEAQSTE